MWDAFVNFLDSAGQAFTNLNTWLGELTAKIYAASNFDSNSTITLVIGTFRFLLGDIVYLAMVTGFYVSVLIVAWKLIPKVLMYWKKFMLR